MANRIEQLRAVGQSAWLDYIRRGLITSGELARMIHDGWVSGMTSNPTIFQKAIAGSNDYDAPLLAAAQRGISDPYEAYLAVCGEDIRLAADVLRPIYDATNGIDGFVSFEAQPGDAQTMIAESKRMWQLVDRPNVMIKIPGVSAGPAAVERLIADGINVNITLLFDVEVYERFAEAYLKGLETRASVGQPVDKLASVASFFVSRVDTKVDTLLPEGSPLRGKVAIANARVAYKRFRSIFDGPRWQRLAEAGAHLQRPLWASTGTKNPAYSDVMYVEELVAPDTVNTLPEATIHAFLDHGVVRPMTDADLEQAEAIVRQATEQAIDIHAVAAELLDEGIDAFNKDFVKLLEAISDHLQEAHPARPGVASLGSLQPAVDGRLVQLERDDVVGRIWAWDHTVWTDDPTEITQPNRLGWLFVDDWMLEEKAALHRFAEGVKADGLKTVVLMGMGGSSLAPEVLAQAFAGKGMTLHILDTTVPDEILDVEKQIDLHETLFIVSSKSGTTIETTSQLAHFWSKVPDGRQYIAITDDGTPLEANGHAKAFRSVWINPSDLGGRYSALSYFGMVPGALAGADIDAIVEAAHVMETACHSSQAPAANPGAWLGAVLGEAALAGRDKLTLLLPAGFDSLGDWIEQLIAESTGKQGKGIVPIVGEPIAGPEVYGSDRLFVAIGEHAGLEMLERAGHPVVRLPFSGPEQIGAEFFRWEFATAVAGHILQINPFDQPNVQQAKDAAARVLREGPSPKMNDFTLKQLRGRIQPGSYVVLQAYLPRTQATRDRLQKLRLDLRDEYHVATALNFGPRYLHSTGQLHKGGPATGVFIQIVDESMVDVPIPGANFGFRTLVNAQAQGDFESLQSLGRPIVRVTLDKLEEELR